MTEDQFLMIPTSEIVYSPFNIREGSDLTELTKSIELSGVIEPIIVRLNAEGKYEVVAGGRRFSASKFAGLKEIPAIVKSLTDEQAFTIQSCENLHRADLSDSEKTALVTFYAEHFQKKPDEIAKQLGMSPRWVLKYLPDRFKDQVKAEAGTLGGLATADSAARRAADNVESATRRVAENVLPAEQPVKVSDATAFVVCERCHVSTDEPKPWNGHTLCPVCHERAQFNPEAYKRFLDVKEPKQQPTEETPKNAKTVSDEPTEKSFDVDTLPSEPETPKQTGKWACDKCGREYAEEFGEDGEPNLWTLRYDGHVDSVATLCIDCQLKLDTVIAEFLEENAQTQEAQP